MHKQLEIKNCRTLLNSPIDSVLLIDLYGTILQINETAARRFRRNVPELIGVNIHDLLPPDLAASRRAFVKKVIDTGAPCRFEDEREGIWYDHILSPVFNDRGDVVNISIWARDITERKRVEEQTKESENRFRGAFENAAVGASMVDINGRFLKVNRSLCKMLGYSEAELLTKTFSDITHPDDMQRGLDNLKKQLKGEADYSSFEKRYICKDGRIAHVIVSPSLVRDNMGKPNYFVGLWQDITERKLAEQALYRIEWLLKPMTRRDRAYSPVYGDITQYNTNRTILNAVSKETLQNIADDFLDLLETSCAVYEKNGDYAMGIFSSGWCRFMDQASFKLCGTDDPPEALACGKWHCHESCWSNASKVSIETGWPVDIECNGGIRLYAIPILSGNEVIGSINFGYGDPPRDEDKLSTIASKYGVGLEELKRMAGEYEARPQFVIDIAKSRLNGAARLIALMVERKRAEEALKKVYDKLEIRVEERTAELKKVNEQLAKEITERKMTENKLREAILRTQDEKAKVDAVIAAIGDGLSIQDTNFRVLYQNDVHKDFVGQHIGEYCYEAYEKVDKICEGCPVAMAFNDGMIHITERSAPTPKGLSYFEITASPLRDAKGDIIGGIEIVRDITERKRNDAISASRMHLMQFAVQHSLDELLEETLNEVEKLTGSLISFYHFVEDDQKSLTLQNWSTRTKAEFCNAEGKGLHYETARAGVWTDCIYQRNPVIHNDYASLPHRKGMPSGHAEVAREMVVPVIRGEKIKAILGVGNKPADYTEKDVETVSLLADLTWEIVERKRAGKLLADSEAKYRAAVETSTDGYWLVDTQGRIIEINDAYISRSGYGREELLNMHISDLEAVENPEETAAHIQKIIRDSSDLFESKHRARDGAVWDVEVNVIYWPTVGGRFFCFFRDITQRKEVEEKILFYQEQLRTLMSKLSVAEEQERRRISEHIHDNISQNLAISKMNLESLHEAFPHTSKELKDTQELIEQTIKFIRSLTFELSPPILHELGLIAAVEWLADKVRERYGIIVECNTDSKFKALKGETGILLFKSIRELMHNITKHAKATNVRISVQGHGDYMEIKVEDDGAGFDASEINDSFIKGESFGIASIRERIRYMNGTFEISSRPGEGTKIRIIVPLHK